jgi:hypothetical protein
LIIVQQLVAVLREATSARVYSRTVGVGLGVGVGATTVWEGMGVGVGVRTTTVGVGVGVGVGTTSVGDGVGVGLTEAVGVTTGSGELVGTARTNTPLLHTRFDPRLIQVNSRFFETTTFPIFLQALPAFGAFALALLKEVRTNNVERSSTKTRRMG